MAFLVAIYSSSSTQLIGSTQATRAPPSGPLCSTTSLRQGPRRASSCSRTRALDPRSRQVARLPSSDTDRLMRSRRSQADEHPACLRVPEGVGERVVAIENSMPLVSIERGGSDPVRVNSA